MRFADCSLVTGDLQLNCVISMDERMKKKKIIFKLHLKTNLLNK